MACVNNVDSIYRSNRKRAKYTHGLCTVLYSPESTVRRTVVSESVLSRDTIMCMYTSTHVDLVVVHGSKLV